MYSTTNKLYVIYNKQTAYNVQLPDIIYEYVYILLSCSRSRHHSFLFLFFVFWFFWFVVAYCTQLLSQVMYNLMMATTMAKTCSCQLPSTIIIIGIQLLGRSGQRPEFSQATGMALVCCILGKFLGVVCHCFPPRLDVPTFATRCLHVRHDARDPSGGRWNCGRECCPVILPK